MSDFKAKMHKIRFGWGSAPDPAVGAYSIRPDSLAGFKGPTAEGREGNGGGRAVSYTHLTLPTIYSV